MLRMPRVLKFRGARFLSLQLSLQSKSPKLACRSATNVSGTKLNASRASVLIVSDTTKTQIKSNQQIGPAVPNPHPANSATKSEKKNLI